MNGTAAIAQSLITENTITVSAQEKVVAHYFDPPPFDKNAKIRKFWPRHLPGVKRFQFFSTGVHLANRMPTEAMFVTSMNAISK